MKSVLLAIAIFAIACMNLVASAQPYIELEFNAATDRSPSPDYEFRTIRVTLLLDTAQVGDVSGGVGIFDVEEITIELDQSSDIEGKRFFARTAPMLTLTKSDSDSDFFPPELILFEDPSTGYWDFSIFLTNISATGIFGTNEFTDVTISMPTIDPVAINNALPNLPSDPNAYYPVRDPSSFYGITMNWSGSTHFGNAHWIYNLNNPNPGSPSDNGKWIGLEARIGERSSKSESCPGDLNEDGNLNFLDVSKFLDLYSMGCE